MKDIDYYRHYRELMVTDQIIFPDKKSLTEFVAKLVARDYKAFVLSEQSASVWPTWTKELMQRELSEPSLVEMYVITFLTEKMEEMGTFKYKVKTLFGRNQNPNKICFDTISNTEMYDFILRKLSQGDATCNVFPRNVKYVIEGNILRRF